LMLAYEPRLGALVLVLNASRVLLVGLLSRRVEPLASAELARAGGEQSTAVQALASAEAVRAFGAEALLGARYADRVAERMSATLDVKRATAQVRFVTAAFDALAAGAILWAGGTAVLAGEMSLGTLVGFFALSLFLQKPMQALAEALAKLSEVRAVVARVDDVLECEPERSGQLRIGALLGGLELENVGFRHAEASPWVCRGVSLRIAAGEKVAVVGRTGAGKTTLARLMLGLLAPGEGRVRVDGVPLSELDLVEFRAQVGVVLQETSLLDASVAENLALGADRVSDDDLLWACRMACIDDVIDALPERHATRLGARGVALSGGQRQRLALARALVRKPRLLLLDEATSSLDLETEARVHRNLSQLGCTRVLIAHRLATVRDADRIIVLEGGQIVEQGTYDELLTRGGPFSAMVGSTDS
jgi:ATP-binding cassette subfamily B protein